MRSITVFFLLLFCTTEAMAQTNVNDSVVENSDPIWKYVEAPQLIEKAKSWYAANCPNGVFLSASGGKNVQVCANPMFQILS